MARRRGRRPGEEQNAAIASALAQDDTSSIADQIQIPTQTPTQIASVMEHMTSSFPTTSRQAKKTCVQCRQRKVRCVSRTPGVAPCDNCRRLRFACVFRDGRGVPGGQDELPRPELRRASKACHRCREHKIRCTGVLPCGGCVKKNVVCEYPGSPPPPGPPPGTASASASGPGQGSGSGLGAGHGHGHGPGSAAASVSSQDVAVAADDTAALGGDIYAEPDVAFFIDGFFQFIYPLPSYSFLHPAQTRRKFRRGTLDRSLVAALAAVASLRCPGVVGSGTLFSPVTANEREEAWIAEAEGQIWEHLESPSVARLQATLLVVLYRVETAQLRRAFMLAALAGRAAAAIRLNHERPALAAATASSRSVVKALEVRRRLMWSLKMVERYFSVGLPEFELCPVENIYIQLPCTEFVFSGGCSASGDGDEDADDGGAYHLCVNLEMFRRDVMKLHRSLALYEQPFPQLPRLVQDFQKHLDEIGQRFPADAAMAVVGRRWLPRYLLMKLSWHQCHCDLYRLVLRNYRDAAPVVVIDALDADFLDAAEALCIHHAQAIAQEIVTLLHDDEQRRRGHPAGAEEPKLLEFDSAICAYTASRILLFTSRFGLTPSRPSEAFALSRAELCLAAVRYFFAQSPLVRPIVGELKRLIDMFSSGSATSPSGFASPRGASAVLPGSGISLASGGLTASGGAAGSSSWEEGEEGGGGGSRRRDPATQLSRAARIRQRLAVHSLLRQAGFSDDDYDDDDDDDESSTGGMPYGKGAAASYVSPSTATTTSTGAGSHTMTGMDMPVFEQSGSPYAAGQSIPTGHTYHMYQQQHQQSQQQMSGGGGGGAAGEFSMSMAQEGNPDPSWPHRYFTGGDDLAQSGSETHNPMQGGAGREQEEVQGGTLNQRSFSFPWLERDDMDQTWNIP